jgi:hypothetical protein
MVASIRLSIFTTIFLLLVVGSSSYVLNSNFRGEKSTPLFFNRHQMKFDLVSFLITFYLQKKEDVIV